MRRCRFFLKGIMRYLKVISALVLPFMLIGSLYAQVKQPNIIFILVDDQGYGDIGAFFQNQRAQKGDRSKPFELSPNLDRMVAAGAMLMQDYCPAPVCAPSRASLMLGQSQGHSNVRNNQFDKALENNYTMPSTLRTLGYKTVAIGKWGLQGDPQFDGPAGAAWPAKPTNRGFDQFFGYMRHMDGHEHYPKEAIYYTKKEVEVWNNDIDITPVLDKCYTADLWTAYAKKWITDFEKGKTDDKPFFMYLAYETPHAVLELPTQPYPAGGGLYGGMQWIGEPHHMITTASGEVDSYIRPEYDTATYDHDHNPATPDVRWPETYKRYAMANRRIDDGVGDLLQLLKDLGLDDNTLVVYTSDNGPSIESYLPKQYVPNHPDFFRSYGPFDGIKRDTWEGGMRMPTIAVWPGKISAGKIINTPTISYDWAATFTAAAGTPAPERMDGISLLPALTGKGSQPYQTLYSEYYEGGRTPDFADFAPAHRNRRRNQMQWIRIGDYAGVRYDIQLQHDDFEIYNVATDPGQRHNLANENVYVSAPVDGRLKRIRVRVLQQWMKDKTLQMRRPNSTAPRPYDSAYIPSLSRPLRVKPGVNWSFYKGEYPWLPQVASLKPAISGSLIYIGVPVGLKENGIVCFRGLISVPEDGVYLFSLKSNSNSLLRIYEAVLIDADYGYEAGSEKQETIRLKKGLHPIRLYYRLETGAIHPGIELTWKKEGSDISGTNNIYRSY